MDKAIISILINKNLEDAWNGTTWEYEGNIKEKPDSGITAMK